jgi:hypothetical protein
MIGFPSMIKNFDYLGTGGSIIDTRVFAIPELFQV